MTSTKPEPTVHVAKVADEPLTFDVIVQERQTETSHRVTLREEDWARLGKGSTPEACVTAAFRFLLDREPKEAILRQFDFSVSSRYFPEFPDALGTYLDDPR